MLWVMESEDVKQRNDFSYSVPVLNDTNLSSDKIFKLIFFFLNGIWNGKMKHVMYFWEIECRINFQYGTGLLILYLN